MSDFNFEQPVEQLYAFMDGELDPAFEQQLFNELARNQELRVEMKDLMTMRQAVQHDIALPSPLVKDRLLTAVGFSGSAAVTVSYWQHLQRLTATFVKPLMGMVLGAGLTAMVLMSHNQNNIVSPVAINNMEQPEWTLKVPLEEKSAVKVVPSVVHRTKYRTFADNSRNEISNNATTTTIVIYPDADQPITESNNISSSFAANEISLDTPQQPNTAIQPAVSSRAIASDIVAKPLRATTIKSDPKNIEDNDDNYDHGLSIRIRGLYNYSYPKSTIAGKENSWVNNAAFGAVYHFNRDISAGVEIGVERFAQVFSGAEGAAEVWYEQNPQMLWAGVLTQYNIWQLESTTNFHVYGETFAGAAGTLGLLGRQSFGVNISPVPAVTFSLGAEAAISPYIFKGQWFSTEKLGLTFGLSFTPEGIR